MSWQPSGARRQSHELPELTIVPRERDLGDGFSVRRVLPHGKRQMIGPFIFFDHMGPVELRAGQGIDVRPHPHIGLATVTYLFEGRVLHRDSLGNALEISPGAMNLMTAGRGIVHSERTPEGARHGGESLFGIQSWVALPQAHEESAPSFQHYSASSLPVVEDAGIKARVIAGSAFGQSSPVGRQSEWLYAEILLDPEATAPIDPDQEERAAYLVEGEVEIAGQAFEAAQLLVFRPGDPIVVRALRPTRLMLLGGASLEGPRYIWWNFVSSRRERIEQAKEDWKNRRFDPVPGETEFIPLPDG